MNRYLYTLFLFIFACLSFQSCEQVLETDIHATAVKLVMVSHFSPNNQLRVDIKKTRPVTDVSFEDDDEYITNAVVQVYQNDEFIEELVLDMPASDVGGHPTYTSIDFIPEVGIEYTLTAEAPGFEKVTATSMIPIGAGINDVGFNNSLDIRDSKIADVNFTVSLNLTDAPNEENFYHLLFKQELACFTIVNNDQGGQDTIEQSVRELAELEVNLLNEIEHIQSNNLGGGIFLRDLEFAGQTIALSLAGNFSFDTAKYLPKNFSVEVRTVSKAYYDYYSTVSTQSQETGDGDPSDANPVIENIQNGNGVFAGYSSETSIFDLGN